MSTFYKFVNLQDFVDLKNYIFLQPNDRIDCSSQKFDFV